MKNIFLFGKTKTKMVQDGRKDFCDTPLKPSLNFNEI